MEVERLSGDYNKGYTKAIMDIIEVFDYIPCDFIGAFEKGKERANYDAILKTNGNWVTDRVFNVVGVELPTKYTPNGVATLEYNGIKFRVDCEPLYELED